MVLDLRIGAILFAVMGYRGDLFPVRKRQWWIRSCGWPHSTPCNADNLFRATGPPGQDAFLWMEFRNRCQERGLCGHHVPVTVRRDGTRLYAYLSMKRARFACRWSKFRGFF